MKNILLYTSLIMFFFFTSFGYGSIRKAAMVRYDYKRALDAGADAAVKHSSYVSQENLENLFWGFGEGYENTNNIPIDKNTSIEWFYRVFFRDIGIEEDVLLQQQIKKYIPMKCILEFDRLSIADHNDNWIIEKQYIIEYEGRSYLFTLSDQIKDLDSDSWVKDLDIGIDSQVRKTLVSKFIKTEIEDFINNRSNTEKNKYYTLNLGLNDYDYRVNTIDGSNFIVFVEGMPIPSLNIYSPTQKLFAFSIGGSEIYRKVQE